MSEKQDFLLEFKAWDHGRQRTYIHGLIMHYAYNCGLNSVIERPTPVDLIASQEEIDASWRLGRLHRDTGER